MCDFPLDAMWLWHPVWRCFRRRIWGFLSSQGALTQAWRVIVAPMPPHPDGRMDGGEMEEVEEGSALAPWNVASPCKLFSLCFNYRVATSKHFECLTEENTRHSFSDVNEPRMPTRSHFASPVTSIQLQWCGCYYKVLQIYLFLVQNSHKDICFLYHCPSLINFKIN